MKKNPGVFTGAERNVRQEVDEAVLVRFPTFRQSGETGQAAQLLIEEHDIAFPVDIAGQIGEEGLEHGDEETGQQVLPEQVVAPRFGTVFFLGTPFPVISNLAHGPTSLRAHSALSCLLAHSIAPLEAAALGLGTTWVGHFDPQKVRSAFTQPENVTPVTILPMGYPYGTSAPSPKHDERLPPEKMTHRNAF